MVWLFEVWSLSFQRFGGESLGELTFSIGLNAWSPRRPRTRLVFQPGGTWGDLFSRTTETAGSCWACMRRRNGKLQFWKAGSTGELFISVFNEKSDIFHINQTKGTTEIRIVISEKRAFFLRTGYARNLEYFEPRSHCPFGDLLKQV